MVSSVEFLFVNTYPPVVPVFEMILPKLEKRFGPSVALVSGCFYRQPEERNYRVVRIWLPRFLNRFKRCCSASYFLWAPFILLIAPGRCNVVFTQPPLFLPVAAAVLRFRRRPYVVHVMDMYPDFLQRTGILSEHGLVYRMLYRLSRWSWRHAQGVIVIGRCMAERVAASGISPDRIYFVPNWAPSNIKPVPSLQNQFRKTNKIGDKFVVMYSGNIGRAHELSTILEVAQDMRGESDVVFVFIGRGVNRGLIEAAIQAGAPNILLGDYQPRDLLAHSLSAADIHFLSIKPGFEGLMVPSKLYGILAAGRPVIFEGSQESEVARTIVENNCGRVVQSKDAPRLKEAILHYYHHADSRVAAGHMSLRAHQETYQADIGVQRYLSILTNIFSRQEHAPAGKGEYIE